MFHDQRQYLNFLHIGSDIICLTAFYYLIVPLFLSTANTYFTLPISVLPHPVTTICFCQRGLFFLLYPAFILIPFLSMLKLKLYDYEYRHPHDIKKTIGQMLYLTTLSTCILSILFFVFKLSLSKTVFFSMVSAGIIFLIMSITRFQHFYFLGKSNSNSNLIRHLLLVGTGETAHKIAGYIEKNPHSGFRLTGFITENTGEMDKIPPCNKILGTIDQLPSIVHNHYTDCVVYTVNKDDSHHHDYILKSCASMGIDFASTKKIPQHHTAAKKPLIFKENIVDMEFNLIKFVYLRPLATFFKRLFDLTASSILITLCLPLWISISISIKTTSPGPIFFRQERIGKYGKKFILFKFRSMVMDAEKMQKNLMYLNEMDGPAFKIKNDPRQTLTGRFLRKTSLDELPQLFNVFRGDISLVGPRPAIEHEVIQYRPIERKRLSVTQGITCIWQVSGRNNIKFDEWMKLDLMYIDNLCTAQDFRILLKTIPAVILKKGAY